MTGSAERFYIPAHGVDDEAVKLGVSWLVDFALAHGTGRAVLMVPTKSQIESLGRAIGSDKAGRLARDGSTLISGVTVEVVTDRTMRRPVPGLALLAVWEDDQQLAKADDMDFAAICVVPWIESNIERWISNWSPKNLRGSGDDASSEPVAVIDNPVVAAAMASLTDRVNLSTGLSHPSDKAAAHQMFKALKSAGEAFAPAQIRAYAVQNGWKSTHAEQLAEMAQKVVDGRVIRTQGGQMWRPNIVDLWRGDADSPVEQPQP